MYGINLRSRSEAPDYWNLVDRASHMENEPSVRMLGYPPHITLAKYDEAGFDELANVVHALAGRDSLTLRFDRIGIFQARNLILWAAPADCDELHRMHGQVHDIVASDRCRPVYRPGQWVPHCTIALSISNDRFEEAEQFAASPFEPFSLKFDVVDFVTAPPIEIRLESVMKGKRVE